jgi:hypothetical protein
MQNTQHTATPAHHVVALFADRALHFRLFNGATLADLADRLDDLGQWHVGTPTAIYLKLGAASQPISVRQPDA